MLMTYTFFKAPTYHWGGWDGHIGGVNCLHLDTFGLVASNACRHQITTRCIEREDESKKESNDIVITHTDNTAVAEGGVTVSTGISPVDLQPNVSVTPIHSESATSYSVSTPDPNTQVNTFVLELS